LQKDKTGRKPTPITGLFCPKSNYQKNNTVRKIKTKGGAQLNWIGKKNGVEMRRHLLRLSIAQATNEAQKKQKKRPGSVATPKSHQERLDKRSNQGRAGDTKKQEKKPSNWATVG